MSNDMKKQYDVRFRIFMRDLTMVSRMKPKEKFLYPIMDGVPFKDLETAILMAKIDYTRKIDDTVNDNEKA